VVSLSADPLQTIWSALEANGCGPRGKPYSFRARCPAHNGTRRDSLSVGVGADGRALLWCHAHQCEPEAITAALGLSMVDLFPDGHRNGRRFAIRPLKRSDFAGHARTVANVLYVLERLEEPWTLMLATRCPYCGSMGAWLHARSGEVLLENGYRDPNGRIDVDCPNGCTADNYVQSLLGRLGRKEAQ
jgi:hypothetical protein